MEDSATRDQSASAGRSTSRLLRYPLRSATKSKEERPPLADSSNSNSSANKRGRPPSTVSKSVGVLEVSGKEKSAKPPRRLSVPNKSKSSPAPKPFGNITPISEARVKRSAGNQGKSDTPVSDVSRSSSRKKFSVISSASYWLSQIKLSESAAKHSISLGFFKLALDAGCEPFQKMSDELKLYVRRHNLSELGNSVKEVFDSYKIPETCSQVPIEGNQLSDDDVKSSSSSITDAEKSLDINSNETDVAKNANIETSAQKTRGSVRKNAANTKSESDVRGRSSQRKPHKPTNQEPVQDKVKKQGKKSAPRVEGCGLAEPLVSPPPPEEALALEENKENMVEPQTEEITVREV